MLLDFFRSGEAERLAAEGLPAVVLWEGALFLLLSLTFESAVTDGGVTNMGSREPD